MHNYMHVHNYMMISKGLKLLDKTISQGLCQFATYLFSICKNDRFLSRWYLILYYFGYGKRYVVFQLVIRLLSATVVFIIIMLY